MSRAAEKFAAVHPAALVCAALLGLFFVLSWRGVLKHSATADEPLHAISAYDATFNGDFRLDVEDPPLWKFWAMIPHRHAKLDFSTDSKMKGTPFAGFVIATRLLFQTPGYDGEAFINSSRFMMVLLGVALLGAIARWTWQVGRAVAALVATTLAALDPNLLAHAALVKNDVALSLVIFCIAWATWSVGRRVAVWNLIVLALLCGAAATIKFSAPLLIPIVAGLLLIRAIVLPEPWNFFGRTLTGRTSRAGGALAIGAVSVLCAAACIWACYGFRFAPTSRAGETLEVRSLMPLFQRNLAIARDEMPIPGDDVLAQRPIPLMGKIVLEMERLRLLPQAYLYGFLLTYLTTLTRASFLLGQTSMTGWWYYFPLAMLFKTPLATLVAMIAAAVGAVVWRKRPRNSWTLACLLLPAIIYGLAAITSNLNIGIRHILPIYPFMYVGIGLIAARARTIVPRGFILTAALLGAGLAVESLAAYPHYIAFFNAISRPYRLSLLSDSNLDWGQDLTYVARWQQEHPQTKLYLAYWGPTDPRFYHIDYTNLPGGFALGHDQPPQDTSAPGVVMISATLLQGANLPQMRDYYAGLRSRSPDELIGDTIYLYKWPIP